MLHQHANARLRSSACVLPTRAAAHSGSRQRVVRVLNGALERLRSWRVGLAADARVARCLAIDAAKQPARPAPDAPPTWPPPKPAERGKREQPLLWVRTY
jgi:hypothetical protein